MTRLDGWGGLLLVVLVVVAAATAGVAADESLTQVDADHELASEAAIQEFHAEGVASGEAQGLDMALTVAEDADDVDLERSMGLRNDYLRIQYDEEISRTIRVFIPAEMTTPYTREGVEALNSSHTASFEPVRDDEYLSVTIHLDGPADVVLPLDRSASASYDILDRTEKRIERITGIAMSGDAEWTYVESEKMNNHSVVEVEADPETAEIQFDARHKEADELWVSMPEGDDPREDIYWYYSETDNRIYVVPKGDDPPTVRYKAEASLGDRLDGAVNDARQTLDKLRSAVSVLPWSDDAEEDTEETDT